MSVTSSTNQFLTLIQEDGSTPTGEGGKIINTNFQRLDSMFTSGSGSSWMAARADYAEYTFLADNASYAYQATTASNAISAEMADVALRTGFASPSNSYSYASLPVAVWGSLGRTQVEMSSSQSGTWHYFPSGVSLTRTAGLPPFGPFCCKVMICAYLPYPDNAGPIFVECMVSGWNLSISFVKVLNAFDLSGNTVTVTPIVLSLYENVGVSDGNCLYFRIYDNQLCCASTFGKTGGYTHISVLSLYPATSDYTHS